MGVFFKSAEVPFDKQEAFFGHFVQFFLKTKRALNLKYLLHIDKSFSVKRARRVPILKILTSALLSRSQEELARLWFLDIYPDLKTDISKFRSSVFLFIHIKTVVDANKTLSKRNQ